MSAYEKVRRCLVRLKILGHRRTLKVRIYKGCKKKEHLL